MDQGFAFWWVGRTLAILEILTPESLEVYTLVFLEFCLGMEGRGWGSLCPQWVFQLIPTFRPMLLSSAQLYLKFPQSIWVSTLAVASSTLSFPPSAFIRLDWGFSILLYQLQFLHLLSTFQKCVELSHVFDHSLYYWFKPPLFHDYNFNEVWGRKRCNSICSVHNPESVCALKCSRRRQGLWGEEMFSFYDTHVYTQFVTFACVSVIFTTERTWERISDLLSLPSVWCWELLTKT